jgi:hypothetical protein
MMTIIQCEDTLGIKAQTLDKNSLLALNMIIAPML